MTNAGERVALNYDHWQDKYYQLLMPIAERLCRGAKGLDPKDLVQETLLRFIKHVAGSLNDQGDESMDGWLIAVMNRHFVDLQRSAMGRKRAEDDPTITRWTLGQGESTSTYERITSERFDRAVDQLPQLQRVTFLLHVQGLGNQEIARRLGVKPNAVAKRLFDARQRLNELLLPYVDEGTH
ncbi:RNA polymerase sigma factor [Corallococcus exiguus]|uniref:RNA polymerase sigma factor n=1 Tax=Corallococcus TaxID=83461 RepID=UPI000EA3F0FB|nr:MULTISPECIES: RNA polymerase sigma factor [Corallococcus]NNC15640.1 RNA polymerase sigma factor [Corallococcus exiguus]RKH24584.1 RNA polymerase sigma factor [Corallococcus sp. CA041A]RKI16962.1 RNA polymerase sigma factor [Corallococcus sp. AB030]